MSVPNIGSVEGGASFLVSWRLNGKSVLVVGGGPVAATRIAPLLEADARITLVAPIVVPELEARAKRGELTWHARPVVESDLEGAALVFSAVDNSGVTDRVVGWARARKIPVNAADRPEQCDFYVPSVHREGPVQIAVATGGAGPALAARLRREIAALLPTGVGEAVRKFGVLRKAIRARDPKPLGDDRRMRWVTELARTLAWDEIEQLDDAKIEALVTRYLDGEPPPSPQGPGQKKGPRVRLVGAGPGDPNLLTVAAKKAIEEADLVLADRLVPEAITALATGEVRVARKLPGRSEAGQEELLAAIDEAVRQGRDVVRLKVGDPFVFGRAGEEVAKVRALGLEAEIIPGISAALAAPLAAGIPVTERGLANRFLVTTAMGEGGSATEVPAFEDDLTLVVLMGVGALDRLAQALQEKGWPADWPAAAISSATRPDQRVVHATLATLSEAARTGQIAAPATLVFGRVAGEAVAHALKHTA